MAKAAYWEYVDGCGNRWQAIVTPEGSGVTELDRCWMLREGQLDKYTSQWAHFPARIGLTRLEAVEAVGRAMAYREATDVYGGLLPLDGAMLDAYNERIRGGGAE